MTTADTEAMTALQELLEERQRYEGWMHALEDKRATTPAHVYNRVYTDYTLRLDRVLHRLSERTEQLRATVDVMTSRLNALRSRESDQVDARQEAELRAAVGEYSEAEWGRIRSEADREIESITRERQSVETELEEMQRIMDLTRAPNPDEQGGIVPSAITEPVVAPAVTQDPLFVEKFVADWPVPRVEPTDVHGATSQDDGVAQQAPGATIAEPTLPVPVPNFDMKPSQAEATSGPEVDRRSDQEKSLKCPECGSFNYATEWYCERCGGELATF